CMSIGYYGLSDIYGNIAGFTGRDPLPGKTWHVRDSSCLNTLPAMRKNWDILRFPSFWVVPSVLGSHGVPRVPGCCRGLTDHTA
ncbi:MAG: hypothetical protein AABY96_07100, partial [Nitrospirota bacterium]